MMVILGCTTNVVQKSGDGGAVAPGRPTPSTPPPCAAAIECERRCTASEEGMSCYEAARRYNAGDGVVRDSHRGLSLASRACTMSVGKGCTLAASIAEFGESSAGLPSATPTPEVCARVRAFQSRGCNLGDPEGCAAYGDWLHGEAIDRSIIDTEAAGCVLNGLVDTSCMDEIRARQATHNAFLARLFARFGCPLADAAAADPPRGLNMLVEACRKGSETGCFRAASAFDAGVGTPKDGAAAQRYWEESCRLGGLSGCGIAARRLSDTNPERAATLLRSACSARGLGECAQLASLLAAGGVRPASDGEELHVAEEACSTSGAQREACTLLWKRHRTHLAREGAERGCDQDGGPACFLLYMLLRKTDSARANRVLVHACEQGTSTFACRCRGQVRDDDVPDGGVCVPGL